MKPLTKKQIDQFPYYVDKWLKIGLSIQEHAIEKEAIKKQINILYHQAELNPPKLCLFVSSPYSACLAFYIIKNVYKMKGTVKGQINDKEWKKMLDKIKAGVNKDSVEFLDFIYGQHEAGWLSFYSFFQNECAVKNIQKINPFVELASLCGWIALFKNMAIICEKPSLLKKDDQNRSHNDGDMAIKYSDGFGVYLWHGTRMPEKYGSVNSKEWKSKWLLEEKNASLRQILIQGIGYNKILKELNAKFIDKWEEYELFEVEKIDGESFFLLKMICPSTGQIHVHRTPPNVLSARDAIKWCNWGVDKEEFNHET